MWRWSSDASRWLLKTDPAGITRAMLEALGMTRTDEAIARAVERSGYQRMRGHEERVPGTEAGGTAARVPVARQPRITRRGKVGEWQEWFHAPMLAARFREPQLMELAAEFGYALNGPGVR